MLFGKNIKGVHHFGYNIAFLWASFSKIRPGDGAGGPISSPLPPNPLHSPSMGSLAKFNHQPNDCDIETTKNEIKKIFLSDKIVLSVYTS